jgi:hypothetical protein
VNFLLDENLPPGLARALHELGEPVRHVVDIPELGKGATDDEIVPFAARWGYRLVGRDKAMLKPSQLKALIHAEGLGMYVFRLGKARQPAKWGLIQIVMKHWPAIAEHARATAPPYVASPRITSPVETLARASH